MNTLYILGAGNMARETYMIYHYLNKARNIKGFVETISTNIKSLYGLPVYGTDILATLHKTDRVICAIGSPLKVNWVTQLMIRDIKFDTIFHPTALMDNTSRIGTGSILCAGVIITTDVTIGNHTIINIGSNISHDCVIGDFVTIAPGTNIAGNVRIGNESWIGIGATIIQNVTIGEKSFIGAGSVVVNNIPARTLAYGVPARPIKTLVDGDWEHLLNNKHDN